MAFFRQMFSCDYSDCTSKEMYDHTGCNCFADHQVQVIMEWRRKGGGGWGGRELPPLSFFSPLLALLLVLVLVTNLVMVASEQV